MIRRLRNTVIRTGGCVVTGLLLAVQTVSAMFMPDISRPEKIAFVDTCQVPNPPVINGSSKEVCRNDSVTLTATGCTGTIIWSNGQISAQIVVQPQQTTRYTAICRAREGCISCFADVWKVSVKTPVAPVVTPSAVLVCPGDAVTLTAKNCTGTVRWPDNTTGLSWTIRPERTSSYQAVCEQNSCVSNPSVPVSMQIAEPTTPVISANNTAICAGQSVQLTASNCLGRVRWSDGGEGVVRSIAPLQTRSYQAICRIGTCQSDSSQTVQVVVRTLDQKTNIANTVTNGCPFQTADLTQAITVSADNPAKVHYAFRTGPSLDAPTVQAPVAVLEGTYYVFARDAEGCYSEPVAVRATITPCQNAIAPCINNPPTVMARLDTLDWTKRLIRLVGRLGGSATQATWHSSGDGLFADTGLTTRYLLSEADRQRDSLTFVLSTPDPDGIGPCVGATARVNVAVPAMSRELVGLSKQVSEPVWITDGSTQLVELTYQLTAVNFGKHALKDVQLHDDLEAAFTAMGADIRSVKVRADSNLVVNSAYTGRGADTTLLTIAEPLSAGAQARAWLTVRLDVSEANTLTFANKASVQAVDINGGICRDQSTNGAVADPNQNDDPTDDDEATVVTLQSARPEEGTTVFIPEGFSPNGDGINDRFVIQRVPLGLTVQLSVFNRWGHVVYQSDDYKNDWDGTANQGIKSKDVRQGLPDGTYFYRVVLSDGREFTRFLTLAR